MRNIFAIALTVFVAIPIAGATGYILKGDPSPLTVKQTVERDLKLREETVNSELVYVVTKGPLVGQEADAASVAMEFTDQELRDQGVLAGKFVKRECSFYTTSGNPKISSDQEVVTYCTQREITKVEVLEAVKQGEVPYLAS